MTHAEGTAARPHRSEVLPVVLGGALVAIAGGLMGYPAAAGMTCAAILLGWSQLPGL